MPQTASHHNENEQQKERFLAEDLVWRWNLLSGRIA